MLCEDERIEVNLAKCDHDDKLEIENCLDDDLRMGGPYGPLWAYWTWFLMPVEGEQMRPVNGFFLYRLGSLSNLFMVQAQGFQIRTYDAILSSSNVLLKDHVSRGENQKYLPKSTAQADVLRQFIEELRKLPDMVLHPNHAAALHHHLNKFQSLLEDELGRLRVYQLEKKRTHEPDVLDGNADHILSAIDRELLTEFALENIREAGRALVFDRFTACGFHAMRAVEDLARKYYMLVTQRPPQTHTKKGELVPITLGQIAGELLDKVNSRKLSRRPIGQLGIVAPLLDQLCAIYRNALTHPEIVKLEEDRAIEVFNQATNVIGTMLNDVRAGGEHLEWSARYG